MTSSSSLYGTVNAQNSSSTNSTSLYGEAGTPIPDSSGNVIVRGDLYVLSGNILTTATTGNIFPENATTINIGLAATTFNIGANTGTTTVNNDLDVTGDLIVNGTFVAPNAEFGNITIAVVDDNTISTTTGNLVLDSATNIVNAQEIQATVGGAGPTGGLNLYSNDASNAIHIYDNYVQIASGLIPGADWAFNEDGTTNFPSYSFPYADGTANQVLTTNGSGVLSFTDVQSLDTNYTIDASATSGGANFNLQGSDATTDTIKFANGTGVTVSQTSASEIGFAIGQDVATSSNVTFADITATDDLTVQGNNVNLAQTTIIGYNENNNRANRPAVQSTTGNSSGFRVLAPNATTSANSNLTVFGSNDIDNGEFMSFQASGSTSAPFAIRTGKYTAGVFSASGEEIGISDGNTLYATINPAGPTNGTDLTTKTYVDALTVGVSSVTGGTHVSASPTTGAVIVTTDATDANTVSTIVARDASGNFSAGTITATLSGTATQVSNSLTAGTHLSGGPFNGSAAVTLTTDATDANTASTIVARDASGNFTAGTITAALTGNATTATTATTATQVSNSLTAGTHLSGGPFNGSSAVTLTTDATDANTASTIVARDASGNFSAGQGTFTTVATPAVSYSGGALTITGGSPAPSVLTLDDTQTTLALDGGAGYGDSTLTTAFNALTWAHTAGVLDIGSVNGTWGWNADGTTDFPNYTFPYASGAANTVLTNDGSGNVSWALPGGGGSTFGNVTVGVDTDQTISTTSGNLILQTAAGVDAGTITLAAGANGNITLAPNGTGVVSSGLTHVATASRALGQMYGTQSTTWTPPATGQTTMTGQNGFYASSSSGGANGFGSTIQSRYYSGDTTLGTSTTATLVGGSATGTNAAPGALASGQVLVSLNADGYATTGWASTIATGTQTPTGVAIAPAQLQFYSREAFADNGTNVTAGGTGMRVRLFNAGTTYTAANRVNIIDHTTTTATYKAATFNIQPAASTSNYAVFAPTTGSINQDTFTIKNNAATSTQATFNSTGASFGSGSSTYAGFTSTGTSIGYVDATVLLDRTTAGTPGVANQKNAFTIESRRSDQAGVTNTDQTGNAFRVGGTGNFYWTNQIASQYMTAGDHIYTLQAAAGDQTSGSPSWLNLATFAPTQTVINAGTAGSGGATAAKLTIDATKITAAVPFKFPTYTAAAANAITGAVGWQISISNSGGGGNPNGMMAFWDTTNSRWSYIHDNSAV